MSYAEDAPPPSRVGRIGSIEGEVSFLSDVADGWQRARLNFPVTSRNSIWIDGPGRAEVRIGPSALRVADNSVLDFVRIDDDRSSVFLQRGSLNVRLRTQADAYDRRSVDDRDAFRLETAEGSFDLELSGRYRLDASPERDETRLTVWVGRARFANGSDALTIEAGKSLLVRRARGNVSFAFETATDSALDRWAEARDQRWDQTHTQIVRGRTLSPYMTGYEDLDVYGDWIDDSEYGRLWAPRVVASGWAPYRFGTWSHIQPWGWTWIDDAPWGFAPFHYGRWVVRHGHWRWHPGAHSHRPVYAPALVAWFGSHRGGVSIGVGSGVGWFPLAPHEHYVPPYSNNVTYIRNINNVTNNITIVNPPQTYLNRGAGTTVVNNGIVLRGEPVQRHLNPALMLAKPAIDRHGPGQGLPIIAGEPSMQSPLRAPTPIRGGGGLVIAGEPVAGSVSSANRAQHNVINPNTNTAPIIRGEPQGSREPRTIIATPKPGRVIEDINTPHPAPTPPSPPSIVTTRPTAPIIGGSTVEPTAPSTHHRGGSYGSPRISGEPVHRNDVWRSATPRTEPPRERVVRPPDQPVVNAPIQPKPGRVLPPDQPKAEKPEPRERQAKPMQEGGAVRPN